MSGEGEDPGALAVMAVRRRCTLGTGQRGGGGEEKTREGIGERRGGGLGRRTGEGIGWLAARVSTMGLLLLYLAVKKMEGQDQIKFL